MGEEFFLDEEKDDESLITKLEDGTDFIAWGQTYLEELIDIIDRDITDIDHKEEFGITTRILDDRIGSTEIVSIDKTLVETNDKLVDAYIDLSQKNVILTENFNKLTEKSTNSIKSLTEEIKKLKLTIEDLQLYVKTPSLTDKKIKNILSKYVEGSED